MEQIKLPSGDDLFQSRLDNGLTVFILPKPGFLRTYAVLSTNFGSIDDHFQRSNEATQKMPPGIAHFLEHKLFEEEEGSVFTQFAALGASVNAFTGTTQTSYLFSTVECWRDALVQLIQFVNSPYLTEENVAKEKGIIQQELLMYEDYPQHRAYSALLENLYHVNPVRLDIGGTVDSVREITAAQLTTCYETFYQPANMSLAVAGDLEPQETLQLIKSAYPSWSHYSGPVQRIFVREPAGVVRKWAEEEMSISRARYLLGFKHDPAWRGEEMLRQRIIMSLAWRLITAPSSPHFNRLYQEDLITDSFGASFSCHAQFSHSVIGSETDSPEQLHEELTKIIERLKQAVVAAPDLERLKRRLYGGHLASFASFEYVCNSLISNHFNQIPGGRFLDLLSSVTADEIQAALNDNLDWERSSVSIINGGEGAECG